MPAGNLILQIIGEPSHRLMETMGETEALRTTQQREALGEQGLEGLKNRLKEAVEQNEVSPSSTSFSSQIETPLFWRAYPWCFSSKRRSMGRIFTGDPSSV